MNNWPNKIVRSNGYLYPFATCSIHDIDNVIQDYISNAEVLKNLIFFVVVQDYWYNLIITSFRAKRDEEEKNWSPLEAQSK